KVITEPPCQGFRSELRLKLVDEFGSELDFWQSIGRGSVVIFRANLHPSCMTEILQASQVLVRPVLAQPQANGHVSACRPFILRKKIVYLLALTKEIRNALNQRLSAQKKNGVS